MWGEDCGCFKPERWISPDGKLKQFSPFKFHAFNVSQTLLSYVEQNSQVSDFVSCSGIFVNQKQAGPRICLGMSLAMLEAVAVTVEILKDFDLEFAPGW